MNDSLKFETENRGYHHGQSDNTIYAYKDGRYVGHIDYSVYNDEVAVQMIDVRDRRKGYGTALVLHLQAMFPDTELKMGMLTGDGAKLIKSLPKTIIKNADVIAHIKRLRAIKATLARYQKKADAVHERGLSDADRVWFHKVTNRWNDLHHEVEDLEHQLWNAKTTKTLYRT